MSWVPYKITRKLQIIQSDTGHLKAVDKETQQIIDGVSEVTVRYDRDSVSGEITIFITNPDDILPVTEVEGSISPVHPQLPEGKE